MTENDTEELEIAEPEDFFVERDSDGNLQPVTQKLPGVEQHIRVVPMTMGDVNKYGLDEGVDLEAEDIAEILNNHWADVVERDDYEITAEQVEDDAIGFGREALIQSILRASGYDMQNALNMEQFEMLADMDEGKFEKVMQLAERQSQ